MINKRNIPKLRFPEFQNAPEWETRPIKDIAENLDNLRIPITENERIKGDIPYYGASGIIDYVEDYIFDEYLLCVSEDGANLVMRNYPIAFSITGKSWVNNHAHVLRFKESFTQIIIENYLNSIKLDDFLTGMAQPKLNKAMLDSIPISLPCEPKEQQKVADCLSSLDELITAQAQKVEALKTHKKSLMQQLFPREGESILRLRFPEFKDDWTIEELGKLGKFLGGGTPSKLVNEYWHGTIPWISSSDINEDNLKTIAITRFINEKAISESATKLIPKGSILFISRVGTGKLAINSVDLCTSQDFTNFIPTQIYNYFLGYYFLANKSALTSLDQGTSIKGFSKSDLEKFKLIYPKNKQEQQKIADCLSSLDELITAQAEKVEALKTHKKALMQQLFPSAKEEVY